MSNNTKRKRKTFRDNYEEFKNENPNIPIESLLDKYKGKIPGHLNLKVLGKNKKETTKTIIKFMAAPKYKSNTSVLSYNHRFIEDEFNLKAAILEIPIEEVIRKQLNELKPGDDLKKKIEICQFITNSQLFILKTTKNDYKSKLCKTRKCKSTKNSNPCIFCKTCDKFTNEEADLFFEEIRQNLSPKPSSELSKQKHTCSITKRNQYMPKLSPDGKAALKQNVLLNLNELEEYFKDKEVLSIASKNGAENKFNKLKTFVELQCDLDCVFGLENLNKKTTCYISALIQSLFSIKTLYDFIYEWKKSEGKDLLFTLNQLLRNKGRNIEDLVDLIIKKTNLKKNIQQDVYELFKKMFPILYSELAHEKVNILSHTIGEILISYKCLTCSNETYRNESLCNLFIKIKKESVKECLEHFEEEEFVDKACEECHKKVKNDNIFMKEKISSLCRSPRVNNMTEESPVYNFHCPPQSKQKRTKIQNHIKRSSILYWGNIFILFAKRFSHDLKKNQTPIQADLEINLKINKINYKYNLVAVISHEGTDFQQGHYITECLRDKIWWKFDDTKISPLGEPTSQNGYMFIYVRDQQIQLRSYSLAENGKVEESASNKIKAQKSSTDQDEVSRTNGNDLEKMENEEKYNYENVKSELESINKEQRPQSPTQLQEERLVYRNSSDSDVLVESYMGYFEDKSMKSQDACNKPNSLVLCKNDYIDLNSDKVAVGGDNRTQEPDSSQIQFECQANRGNENEEIFNYEDFKSELGPINKEQRPQSPTQLQEECFMTRNSQGLDRGAVEDYYDFNCFMYFGDSL